MSGFLTAPEKKLMGMKSRYPIQLSIDLSKHMGCAYFIIKFPNDDPNKPNSMQRIVSAGVPYALFQQQDSHNKDPNLIIDVNAPLPYMASGLFSGYDEELQEYLLDLFKDFLLDTDKIRLIRDAFERMAKIREIESMAICFRQVNPVTFSEWKELKTKQ